MALTRDALPKIDGIMSVASTAAIHTGSHTLSVYLATKAFVLSFAETMRFAETVREEDADTNLRVTCTCDG